MRLREWRLAEEAILIIHHEACAHNRRLWSTRMRGGLEKGLLRDNQGRKLEGWHDHGSVDRVRQTVSCPAHRARRPGDVAGALGGRTCTCTLKNACGLKIGSARAKGMRANSCHLYWVVTSFVDGSFVDGRRARKCQRVSAAVRVGE